MIHCIVEKRARQAAALMVAVAVTGCFGSGPNMRADTIVGVFNPKNPGRVVDQRSYEVGQRYNVRPGEAMVRRELFTLMPEGVRTYRADLDLTLNGDGLRVEVPLGAHLLTADRMLVKGKVANVIALPQPQASNVSAILANNDGQLIPAVLVGKRLVMFEKYEVIPKKARLTPEVVESVNLSRGYINYEVSYNGNMIRDFIKCPPPRRIGVSQKPQTDQTVGCGSGIHLDLTTVSYSPDQRDRISSTDRSWYPVHDQKLVLQGLNIRIHEVATDYVVFEVVEDRTSQSTKFF